MFFWAYNKYIRGLLQDKKSHMKSSSSQNVLKCPYCNELLSSHKALRIHVGAMHLDKVDDFVEEFFGGRSIEVDFVTLMLQRAIGDLTAEFCEQCGKCTVGCPITQVAEGFTPSQIVADVRLGKVKELFKSDIIWTCASCLACEEQCPHEFSPYNIIKILRNLSARIGYHFPRGYKNLDKNVRSLGLIQGPQTIHTGTGERFGREDLGLPGLKVPIDMKKFTEALKKLPGKRVIL